MNIEPVLAELHGTIECVHQHGVNWVKYSDVEAILRARVKDGS